MKKYTYLVNFESQTLERVGESFAVKGDGGVAELEFAIPSNFGIPANQAVWRVFFRLPGEKESLFETLPTVAATQSGDYVTAWVISKAITQKAGRLAFSLAAISGNDIQWNSRTVIMQVPESQYQPESEESEEPYTGRLTILEGDMAQIRGEFAEVQDDFEELKETATLGTPIPESLVANMQEGHIYIYTGTETGYTAGHVYYYVGGALTDGGVYGGTAVDATLTQSGQAADAAVTGAEISAIKEDLSAIQTATSEDVGKALKAKTVADGKVTGWEFGEAGESIDTDKTLKKADIPADAEVTGKYIRAILNLLKGAAYDQNIIGNASHIIDMLDIEILGIYTLPEPLVCNADQFIDTGFSVTSEADYGYTNDWYILLDAKIDAASHILGNSNWWFMRQQSSANNSMLVVRDVYDYEGKIPGQILGNRYKYVITYNHSTNKLTAYGSNNASLVAVSPNIEMGKNWGKLMIGGRIEASFKGTIYQLDIRLGTLTETEIKAYVGVE